MKYPTHLFEWVDFWLEYYHKPAVKFDTYSSSFYNVKIMKKNAINRLLADMDEFCCQAILNSMYDNGYARATIQKVATILRQSLLRAKRNGCISDNPTEFLVIPKAPIKVVEALTQDEQVKIENACSEISNGYLFMFLLNTGLRRCELINLKWQHFDKKSREIFIEDSKAVNGIKTVPLITSAYNIIIEQKKSKQDDFIFHSVTGKKLSNTIMRRLYNQIRAMTGISDFTNHVCRHMGLYFYNDFSNLRRDIYT